MAEDRVIAGRELPEACLWQWLEPFRGGEPGWADVVNRDDPVGAGKEIELGGRGGHARAAVVRGRRGEWHESVKIADAEVAVEVGGLSGRPYGSAFAEAFVGGGVNEDRAEIRLRSALPVGAGAVLSPECVPGGYP